MNYRVISIGALSHHDLWEEDTASRTAHATTTLVSSGDRHILIDPGLPPQVISARLHERSGLKPEAITDVFLTNFRPAHRMGLAAFEKARWLIFDTEREAIGRALVERFEQETEADTKKTLQEEINLLRRFKSADDQLAEQVDLFPLPGYTPGTCGLLLSRANATVLIAGDAVASREHLEAGRVLPRPWDADKARQSFVEAIEIADVIIPGHDNLLLNATRRRF
ncbi:MAG: MBL fold metallo-hydrolase [Phycisphaeraceae bacterium]|nr:MBL fold metallo-hydrolase [Phycisphaeraceae bacterium]